MLKGFKTSFILVIVALLLFTIIAFLINSSFAAKTISSKISNSFSGSIKWSDQKVNLFTGKVSVDNFAICEKNGDTVIFADNVYAQISLLKIIGGKIIVQSGTINNPIVKLEKEKDSLLNIISLFDPVSPKKRTKKSEKPLIISLSNITISNGDFKYSDNFINLKSSLQSINIFGNYDINKSIIDGELKSGQFKFSLNDSLVLDSINCTGTLNGSNIDEISFNAFNKNDFFELSGKFTDIYNIEKLKSTFNANTQINTKNYKLTNNKLPLSGLLNIKINQDGSINNPESSILIKFNKDEKSKVFDHFIIGACIKDRILMVDSVNSKLSSAIEIKSSGMVDFRNAFPFGFLSDSINVNRLSYQFNTFFKSLKDNNTISKSTKDKVKKVEGNLKFSGKGINQKSLILNGIANSSSLFYPTKNLKDSLTFNGSFSINREDVSINAIIRSNYTGEGKVIGSYNLKSELIAADISNLMFDSEILNSYIPVKLKGIYTINANCEGHLKKLKSDIFINGDNITVDTVSIEKLRSIISVDNSEGNVYANLQALSKIGYGELKVNSKFFNKNSITLKKNPFIYGELSLNLSDISPIIRNDISGDLKITAHYEGDLNNGQGVSNIYSEKIGHDIITAKKLNAHLIYKDKNITMKNLNAILPGGKINTEGTIQNFKTFTLNSNGTILLDSIKKVEEYNTKGFLKFELKSHGDFKTPVAQLSLGVENPVLLNQKVDSLIIESNLVGNIIDFNIYSDFKSYGNFKLKNKEYSIHATLDSTDFMTFILPKDQGAWNGTISGYSYIKGFGKQIDSIVLDFYDFKLNYDTLNLATSDAISLYYGGDSLFVKNVNVDLINKGYIKCDGGFSSLGNGKIDAFIKIPYSALEYFTDAVDKGQGFVDGQINIKGDIKQPYISGSLQSDSGCLYLTSTDQLLENIKFTTIFNEKFIKIEKGSTNIDKGKIAFNGILSSWIKNSDSAKVEMNLEVDNVPIIIPDEGEFSLSGDIKINSSIQEGIAQGNFKLLEGIYYKDINLNLFSKERSISKREKDKNVSILDNIKLDIQLLPYKPLTIDNNVAYLNVLPQVKLKGTASTPIVAGRAKVKDGFITFRNREFQIKRGFLDFIDPYSNNPDIDIEAEVKIDKWVVTIAIDGNANDKLNFRLYSTPMLSDREILSLLLIGRPEISGIEDAISVAGDFAGEYLGRTVERINTFFAIPIDKVSVSSDNISEGLTVNLEQDVSKYLSTIYSINMKNGDVTRKAELLLRMFDNFSAKGFSETSGRKGFEVEAGFEKQ